MARHRKLGKLLLPLAPQRSRGLHTRTAPTPHRHTHTHTALLVFSLVCFPLAQVDGKTRHEALSSEETLAQSVCPEDCCPSFSLGRTAAALLPSTTSGCGRTLNSSRQTRADSPDRSAQARQAAHEVDPELWGYNPTGRRLPP